MAEWGFTYAGNPPTLNATYKIVDFGLRCRVCGRGPKSGLKKAEGVERWQQDMAWLVKTARPSGWAPGRRTVIEVEWYTLRKHDGDAGNKALQDALAHALGCNDEGFLIRVMANEVDKASPRTVVRVIDA